MLLAVIFGHNLEWQDKELNPSYFQSNIKATLNNTPEYVC